jgi:pimeloyl-ACP methyl ester carboxylesterase
MNSEDYEGGFDASDIEAMLSHISSDFRGWAESFVPLAVGSADPSTAEPLARSFFAMDPRVAHELARMIFLGDQREVLDRVAAPCTLVHVSRDFAAPPCVGRYMQARMLAARCPAAAMETIDSVGHYPQLVAPDELLDILDLVLDGSSSDRKDRDGEDELMNGEVDVADADVKKNSDIGLAPQPKLFG